MYNTIKKIRCHSTMFFILEKRVNKFKNPKFAQQISHNSRGISAH